MAKITQYEARRVYADLKSLIDDCVKNDAWELYKNKTLIIAQWIKKLKSYLENRQFTTPVDDRWADELEYFEAAYYKIIYYSDLWASTDWIMYTLENNKINLNKKGIKILTYNQINAFVDNLLSFRLIKTYRAQIAKIINANINPTQLLLVYDHVRTLTDNFRRNLNKSYAPVNEKFSAGFFNPFNNDEKEEIKVNTPSNVEDRIIRKIKIYNSKNQEGGIKYKANGVYANTTFYKDDIIEEAPVYILHDADLYSPNVRKLTFMIDPSKRLFGIPMGMATVARCSDVAKKDGNIDYEFDPEKGNKIVIYATKKIKRGEELIFEEDNICESENVYDICSAPIDMIKDVTPSSSGVSNNDPIHSGYAYKSLA